MIKPDDDFEDDFDDDDSNSDNAMVDDVDDTILEASGSKPDPKHHDTRRKIEDILERRRLREEFGDMDY